MEDVDHRLWTTFQRVHENVIQVGLPGHMPRAGISTPAPSEHEPDSGAVDAGRGHVLTQQTQQAAIDEADRRSMVGSLRWLEQESISQAGRRYVTEVLGMREYLGKPAATFFTECYALRSALVHGRHPYPTVEDVAGKVGQLEVFVSDLLTTPYLGPRADWSGGFPAVWTTVALVQAARGQAATGPLKGAPGRRLAAARIRGSAPAAGTGD